MKNDQDDDDEQMQILSVVNKVGNQWQQSNKQYTERIKQKQNKNIKEKRQLTINDQLPRSVQQQILKLILISFAIFIILCGTCYTIIVYNYKSKTSNNFINLHQIKLLKVIIQTFQTIHNTQIKNLLGSFHQGQKSDEFSPLTNEHTQIQSTISSTTDHTKEQTSYQIQNAKLVHNFTIDQIKQLSNTVQFKPKAGIDKDQFLKSIQKLILPNVLNYKNCRSFDNMIGQMNSGKQLSKKQGIKGQITDKINQIGKQQPPKFPHNKIYITPQIQQTPLTSKQFNFNPHLSNQQNTQIQNILIKQKYQYQKKYSLQLYNNKAPKRFCIFIIGKYLSSSQNGDQNHQGQEYKRTLNSIFMQQYQNYHIVYSIGQEYRPGIEQYLKQNQVPEQKQKFQFCNSYQSKTQTIYRAIHEKCSIGKVAILMTQGDTLIGRQALSIINSQYQSDKNPAVVYTQNLVFNTIINTNVYTESNPNFNIGNSNQYQPQILQNNRFRRLAKLLSLQLQTFYVDLFLRIQEGDLKYKIGKVNNLKEEDGGWKGFQRLSSENSQNKADKLQKQQNSKQKFFNQLALQAIMYPLLQMASPNVLYVQQILYEKLNMMDQADISQKSVQYNQDKASQMLLLERQAFFGKKSYNKLKRVLLSEYQYRKIRQKYNKINNKDQQNPSFVQSQTSYQTESPIVPEIATINKDRKQVKTPNLNINKHTAQAQHNLLLLNNRPNINNLYSFTRSLSQMKQYAINNYRYEQQKNITKQMLVSAVERLWINRPILDHNKNDSIFQHTKGDMSKKRVSQETDNGKVIVNGNSADKNIINIKDNNNNDRNIKESQSLPQSSINQIQQTQLLYFQQKYQISKYLNPQQLHTFCVIIPSYQNYINNLYVRNLNSIFMQSYTNYHVVYVDDCSPDQTGKHVLQYVQKYEINKEQRKIEVIVNKKRQGAMFSIYHGIRDHCKNGQIVVLVDGDDALVGRQVFAVLNAVFNKEKVALLYTQHMRIQDNFKAFVGISAPFTSQNLQNINFRSLKDARCSHLKAFYVDLFKLIKKQDLTYDGNLFYQAASDTAIMKPMLQMANPRIIYLPQIMYEYRSDTGISGNQVQKKQQQYVKTIIAKGRKYQSLKQFGFIRK